MQAQPVGEADRTLHLGAERRLAGAQRVAVEPLRLVAEAIEQVGVLLGLGTT